MSSVPFLPLGENFEYVSFWRRVDMSDVEGCWIWSGGRRGTPGLEYGAIRVNGVVWGTHRLAYTIVIGPIPAGLYVCHTCDNPLCVNPGHLWVGTHLDNMRDKARKGRASVIYGEANRNSRLTEDQVVEIRQRFANGGSDQQTLASEYGVARSLIGMIVRGDVWKRAAGPRTVGPRPRTNTGYFGVSQYMSGHHKGRYQAYIDHEQQRYNVGTFDDAEQAARARDTKAREFGFPPERLNFPD